MKFLVDESTGIKVCIFLKQLGFDVIGVAEENSGANDKKILGWAEREKRVLVTNDKDFGDLIFYQKLNSHGVILLRLKYETVENKIYALRTLLTNHKNKIKNNFIVLTDNSIRIRKL